MPSVSVPPRRLLSCGLLCLLLAGLAACAPRYVAKDAAPDPAATIQPIYVATQRRLDRAGAGFGGDRSSTLNHFRADISIPPTHRPGQIEWAKDAPDAATDFVVVDTKVFQTGAAMKRDLSAAQNPDETTLFVHGYNYTLSEAMYRFAQIRHDFDRPGPGVMFAWQSAGDPRGYIYDRDSVLFARDALVDTLRLLTQGSDEQVFVLAHSMGSQLAMEALRQIALTGDRHVLDRISGVALISPDIDPDLFRRQVVTIGDLRAPITVLVSRQDRVLGLASLLFGAKQRLGVIDSPRQVEGLDVSVIDVTALGDGEGLSHFIPATSAKALNAIRALQAGDRRGVTLSSQYTVIPGTGLLR